MLIPLLLNSDSGAFLKTPASSASCSSAQLSWFKSVVAVLLEDIMNCVRENFNIRKCDFFTPVKPTPTI
jgi:hypothetical protein